MVIIRIIGGLGSQIRLFTLGYLLAQRFETDLYLDIDEYVNGYFRPFLLHLLNMPKAYILMDRSVLSKAITVSNGKELQDVYDNHFGCNVYLNSEDAPYKDFYKGYPELYPNAEVSFFKDLTVKFRSEFLDEFQKFISDKRTIGIHLRLGDFATIGWLEEIERYKGAIGYLLMNNPTATVFVFSDEPSKAKELLGENDFIYIDYQNGYLGDIEQLYALAMCEDKIASTRSGYSRYAVYLGMNLFHTGKGLSLTQLEEVEDAYYFISDEEILRGKSYLSERDISPICQTRFAHCYEKAGYRYDNVLMDSQIPHSEKEIFWQHFFSIANGIENYAFVIFPYESFNRWYYKKYYRVAMILGRLGIPTLYISRRIGDSCLLDENSIIPAKNVDGVDLDFELYLMRERRSLSSIINEWSGQKLVNCNKMVKVLGNSVIDFLNVFFSKFFKENAILKDFSKNGKLDEIDESCLLDSLVDLDAAKVLQKWFQ